jgi:hypothetical protein
MRSRKVNAWRSNSATLTVSRHVHGSAANRPLSDANSFKSKFEEAKTILLEKCKLYNEEGEVEECGDPIGTEEVMERLAKLEMNKQLCDGVDKEK